MRLKATIILFVLLVFGQAAWAADTLYTEKAAMEIYASQPERALQIIDSAVILGNMDPLRADLLRAFIFSRTNEEMNYDSHRREDPKDGHRIICFFAISRLNYDRFRFFVAKKNFCFRY